MKSFKIFLWMACAMVVLPCLASAQSTPTASQNHILVRQARVATPNQQAFASLSDPDEVVESVQYFDGLGRPIQTVEVAASPSEADIVSFQVYDNRGRESMNYLPFTRANNNGKFRPHAPSEQAFFYNQTQFPNIPQNDLIKPYSETVFEASPLSRLLEQGAPGEDWQIQKVNGQSIGLGHTTKAALQRPNTAADLVLHWRPDANGTWFASQTFGDASQLAIYPPGSLFVDEVADPNGNISLTFSDKLGRVILKRKLVGNPATQNPHDAYTNTYFLYDDMDNLRFVLQPEGCTTLSLNSQNYVLTQELLEQYAFQYVYDARQRVVEKRIPGADWVYTVYDPLDRVVATQDGKLRQTNDWLFTKYDALGRPVMTGIFDNPANYGRSDVQFQLSQAWNNGAFALFEARSGSNFATQHGYSNQAFPALVDIVELHSVTYFDDYDFNLDGAADVNYIPVAGFSATPTDRVSGLVTGVKVRVLDPAPDMPDWLMTVSFFDEYARELQTQAGNHLSDGAGDFNQDLSTHAYNFAGEVLKTQITHNHNLSGSGKTTVLKSFVYDHRSRLLEMKYQLDGGQEVILSALEYNELGQMIEKNLHSKNGGANFLQSLDYAYNIQGWLTDINDVDAPMAQAPCNTGGGRSGSGSGIALDRVGVALQTKGSPNGDMMIAKVFVNEEVNITQNNQQVTISLNHTGTPLKQHIPISGMPGSPFMDTVLVGFPHLPIDSVSMLSVENAVETAIMTKMNTAGFAISDQEAVSQASTGLLKADWNSILDEDDNQDLFAERLTYQGDDGNMHADATAQYNGNIRSMQIRTAGACQVRRWDYSYDALNRLTNAHYKARDGQAVNNPWNLEVGRYSTTDFTYDFNGNIKGLTRSGKTGMSGNMPTYGQIDDLTYTYLGNRLIEVSDLVTTTIPADIQQFIDGATAPVIKTLEASHEYQYDADGNITADKNKGIEAIAYNYMNKPTLVSMDPTKTVAYIYAADGSKLRQTVTDGSTVTSFDYVNGFHYKTDNGGQTLQFFSTEEGRVVVEPTAKHFEYSLKDHLGNTRVSLRENPTVIGEPMMIQENHYYAFGMSISDLASVTGLPNDYLYNGKERQDELGIGWYDYGARMYDPSIGRWNGVDPLAEQYGSNSPYNYTLNNPILLVDPDGRSSGFSNAVKGYINDYYNAKHKEDNKDRAKSSAEEHIARRRAKSGPVSGGSSAKDSGSAGSKQDKIEVRKQRKEERRARRKEKRLAKRKGIQTEPTQTLPIHIELQRTTETDVSTIGQFTATGSNGETVTGEILEPRKGTPEETITEKSKVRVKAGTYTLVKHVGKKYKNHFRLVGVPGRTGIVIHVGNDQHDTEGCLLPGEPSSTPNFVGYSDRTIRKLRKLVVESSGYKNFRSIPAGTVIGTITITDPSDN